MVAVPKFKAGIGSSKRQGRQYSSFVDAAQNTKRDMEEIVQKYKDFIAHMKGVGAGVLQNALYPTFILSGVYVPKDTGDLHRSGYLEARTTANGSQVEVGYAKGGFPDYAVLVHEDPVARHRSPQTYKFLERALKEDFGNVQARIFIGYQDASGIKG